MYPIWSFMWGSSRFTSFLPPYKKHADRYRLNKCVNMCVCVCGAHAQCFLDRFQIDHHADEDLL